jgi:hypothetical protein
MVLADHGLLWSWQTMVFCGPGRPWSFVVLADHDFQIKHLAKSLYKKFQDRPGPGKAHLKTMVRDQPGPQVTCGFSWSRGGLRTTNSFKG